MRICAHCNNVYNDNVTLCPVCDEQTFQCSDSVDNNKINFENLYQTEDEERQNLNITYRNDIRTLNWLNNIVTAVLIMVTILFQLVNLCQDKLQMLDYIHIGVDTSWIILIILLSHFLIKCSANHFESSLYYNEGRVNK